MATGQLSRDVIQHARGLYANYNSYVSQTSVNKAGLVYYCTDEEGTAYHGCIVYNDTIYGQGNGGVTGISAEQVGNGIKVTLTFKDGTIQYFTIPKADTSTYGVVKTTNSITGDNTDDSLVPTYSVVKALDTNKAPLNNPNFTGTPKISNKEIATKEDVTNAISANDAMRYKGTLGASGAADVTSLPEISNNNVKNGDKYVVVTAGTYNDRTCKVGDSFVANKGIATNPDIADKWDYIPSGDDAGRVSDITSDTLDVSQSGGDALVKNIELKELFKSPLAVVLPANNTTPKFGDKITIPGFVTDLYGRVASNDSRELTIPATIASKDENGLMSSTDKTNLDAIAKALLWIDVTA